MSNANTDRTRRGRPYKAEAKRRQDQLLDHALTQFSAQGYRATTLDGLVAGFGASKATIYRRYGSKVGLLRAVMARSVPALATKLAAVDASAQRDVAAVLRDMGQVIQSHHADPSIQALLRAVNEAQDELGHTADDARANRSAALAPMIRFLSQASAEGRLALSDPETAAACFTDMVAGGLTSFLSAPDSHGKPLSSVDFAVDLFLRGASPR